MKVKKQLIEIIPIVLALYIFFEGIYKIAFIKEYYVWLKYAPYLDTFHNVYKLLVYIIPAIQLISSILILLRVARTLALSLVILLNFIFLIYIILVAVYTSAVYWPFLKYWHETSWMEKSVFILVQCWLAFIALAITSPKKVVAAKISVDNKLKGLPSNA